MITDRRFERRLRGSRLPVTRSRVPDRASEEPSKGGHNRTCVALDKVGMSANGGTLPSSSSKEVIRCDVGIGGDRNPPTLGGSPKTARPRSSERFEHASLMGDFHERRKMTVRAFSRNVAETCGDSVETSLRRPRDAVAHTVNEDMNVAYIVPL